MDGRKRQIAQACLEGAESDTMTFPEIVGTLMQEGFEGYALDFRRAFATYYPSEGEPIALPAHTLGVPIAGSFDPTAIQAAIGEAQRQVSGYTYIGFCEKVAAAGCAGYVVSFSGRRALYIGRTAETHVEPFPD